MKWLFLLFLTNLALAKDPLRVGVVDTGLNLKDPRFFPYLCESGHKDFTNTTLDDTDGHGTHITGLIIKNAGDSGYCLVILKYYKEKSKNNRPYIQALFEAATVLQLPFVNISGGGPEFQEGEYTIIQYAKNTIFVVAAGNDNVDLQKKPYYPATYPLKNVIAVGGLDIYGNKSKQSNYGKLVDAWELGENVESTCINGKNCLMTGTSMSAPIHLGKLIKKYVKSH